MENGEPTKADAWQLFNLKNDPKEKSNIAAQHPEIVLTMHQRFLTQRSKDKKKSK